MLQWPVPKTLRELRGFLGLTGYYRKFVKNYGKIAWPLTDQLKKDNFHWNDEATKAFHQLQSAMTQVPVLALPNFDKEFVVETDASGFGLGAVLMQEGRPLAFFSYVLGTRARLKSVYERELMAIVMAIQKWRPYLLGCKFVVKTDQRSLKYLLEQRTVTEEHQKWLSKLLGYNFDIVYHPGKENSAADALSRKPAETQLTVLTASWKVDWNGLKKDLEDDVEIQSLKRKIAEDESIPEGYTVESGNLLFKGRLVLPKGSGWIPVLCHEFHSSVIGGHSGVQKTYQRMAREVYWAGMKGDVAKFVAECDVCQRQKYSTMAPSGLLQPLALPTTVWSELTMDFIDGLPRSEGFTVIFVVVDRLSKYAHFIPLKHPYTAPMVATIFIKEVVRLHGVPESIVSDRDKVFLSNFWKELFKLLGTTLKRSTAYHPQTDGQTEVVNRCVETYLRCFVTDTPKKWVTWLPWAEYWYNTCFHTSTKTTPFRVLYGRDPPHLLHYGNVPTPVSTVDQYLLERDQVLQELRGYLFRAQQLMKTRADEHRRDVQFAVGDWAYLKLKPYRQRSVAQRRNEKLALRFFGPFEVLEKIGKVAYRLKLPASARIHDVLHVSQLRRAIGNRVAAPQLPATLTEEMEVLLQPNRVEGVRDGTRGPEVLIRWKDLPEYEATWEPFEAINRQFPDFHLEDKVVVWRGSNDMPGRYGQVYQRRQLRQQG